jgi:hypothetical protein
MFATIIVLVGGILITPSLVGHTSELTSLPEILIAICPHDQSEFVIDVTAAVEAYLFANVTIQVNHMNPDGANMSLASYARNDTYGGELYVPVDDAPLWIHTRLVDIQGNYFEYNLTLQTFYNPNNGGRLTMVINFPDEHGAATKYLVPPNDLRWPIPRRGTIP